MINYREIFARKIFAILFPFRILFRANTNLLSLIYYPFNVSKSLVAAKNLPKKKNLHAFHPPEHVTETRPEILSNCARIFTA